MGLNGVVSGYPTSTNFQRVDGLSKDPWDLGCHTPGSGHHKQKFGVYTYCKTRENFKFKFFR